MLDPGPQAPPWELNSELIPSKLPKLSPLKRAKVFLQNVSVAPKHRILRPARHGGLWAIFFAYSPSGSAFDQHDFTIRRLRDDGFYVLVVLAIDPLVDFDPSAWASADALILKGLKGYDFSGYQIGLRHLVDTVGTVDVLVLNDSVFGPFSSLREVVQQRDWRLTGFTSSFAVENHIQSYAFFIRAADSRTLTVWTTVMLPRLCLTAHHAVAYVQETRLARVAVDSGLSVGALWSPKQRDVDLLMAYPLEILGSGFPFLKRSTVGKFSHNFDSASILEKLRRLGHPMNSKGLFEGFDRLTSPAPNSQPPL